MAQAHAPGIAHFPVAKPEWGLVVVCDVASGRPHLKAIHLGEHIGDYRSDTQEAD